jgi:hypothetical protein
MRKIREMGAKRAVVIDRPIGYDATHAAGYTFSFLA